MCKRAEVAESIEVKKRDGQIIEVDTSDSSYDRINHRSRKKEGTKSKRTAKKKSKMKVNFYCDRHGRNDSHDTVDCKCLKAELNVI